MILRAADHVLSTTQLRPFFKNFFSDERIAKQFLEDFFNFKIELIELLPLDHKLTNEASLMSFDYRCKINGKFIIIDIQQWYKHNVVKRFYMYHAANTVLQLENLPFKKAHKEQKVKDYSELLPVITLISMLNVSATQQLAKENEQLKKRVAELENQVSKVNQLEAMLEELQVQMNGDTK